MNNKEYWDKKIIEWEDSIRGGDVSFIERVTSYFREPVKFRAEICLNILEPFVRDKTVLELGCGSGFFAFKLYGRGKAKHITGIDISGNAIKRAQKMSRDKKLTDIITFIEGDAISIELPQTDIMIGLGFLDYLTLEEITSLFDNMKSKYFIFDFSEKKFSLLRYLHILYLWTQKCPKHFYFTKDEIIDCISRKHSKTQFLNDEKLSFCCIVHNLPIS